MEYRHLFQPLQIKHIRFKNRIFSPPVQTTFLDGNGYYTDYAIEFFAERARGGAAMVCVGDTPVDSRYAASTYRHPVLDDPGTLPSLCEVVRAVHEYGAAAAIELNHAGSMAHPQYITGSSPIGPVDYIRKDGQPVKGMDSELMNFTLDSYAQSAAMAKLAGFDVITIQAGHGWLLHQFLSPRTNTRKDLYGGSLRNRFRFPLEVLSRVREVVGSEILIQLSISAAEHIKGGDTLANTIEFIKMAHPYVDFLHVTASVNTDSRAATIIHSTPYQPHKLITHYASAIKATTNLPVVAVGSILSPDSAEEILTNGEADAVAMGRALLADPYLPYKTKHRKTETIRPCIRCLTCLNEMSRSRSFSCTVNPTAGREFRFQRSTVSTPVSMRIVVVGGGPAGMSAALSAANCGHSVTLFERTSQLGGLIGRTLSAPYKTDTAAYLDYLERAIRTHPNIRLCLSTCATPQNIAALSPQAVIIATGSLSRAEELPRSPQIPVMEVSQLYDRLDQVGSCVLIVGGGVSGCEAALCLAEEGRSVTILDEQSMPMPRFSRLPRIVLADKLASLGVSLHSDTKVTQLTTDGVVALDKSGKSHSLSADTILLANGRRPDFHTIDHFAHAAPIVVAVGGCAQPSSLRECIHSGYFAGQNINYY